MVWEAISNSQSWLKKINGTSFNFQPTYLLCVWKLDKTIFPDLVFDILRQTVYKEKDILGRKERASEQMTMK